MGLTIGSGQKTRFTEEIRSMIAGLSARKNLLQFITLIDVTQIDNIGNQLDGADGAIINCSCELAESDINAIVNRIHPLRKVVDVYYQCIHGLVLPSGRITEGEEYGYFCNIFQVVDEGAGEYMVHLHFLGENLYINVVNKYQLTKY